MRWLFRTLWAVALLACPVGMTAIMLTVPKEHWRSASPKVGEIADWLFTAHLAVSLVAAVLVLVSSRPSGTRLVLCVAIFLWVFVVWSNYFVICLLTHDINL